jgi:hypothetical protein
VANRPGQQADDIGERRVEVRRGRRCAPRGRQEQCDCSQFLAEFLVKHVLEAGAAGAVGCGPRARTQARIAPRQTEIGQLGSYTEFLAAAKVRLRQTARWLAKCR